MLDYIMMETRKVNRQKGYWMAYIENTSGNPFFSRVAWETQATNAKIKNRCHFSADLSVHGGSVQHMLPDYTMFQSKPVWLRSRKHREIDFRHMNKVIWFRVLLRWRVILRIAWIWVALIHQPGYFGFTFLLTTFFGHVFTHPATCVEIPLKKKSQFRQTTITDKHANRQTVWLTDCITDWMSDWQTEWVAESMSERVSEWVTDW